MKFKIGIRNSKLSNIQTQNFIEEICLNNKNLRQEQFQVKHIKTSGDIHNNTRLDQIGGKGLFIREIEKEIISGEIDFGIHSVKDMPVKENSETKIACWSKRLDPREAFISNSSKTLMELPSGSLVGTSSVRRRAQVLSTRSDLSIKLLRGNVDTRIKKLRAKEYDAIILSYAGLCRLGLQNEVNDLLDLENFLPPAGQGSVGIQTRSESKYPFLDRVNDQITQYCCEAERHVLRLINANCNSPISVYAKVNKSKIIISSKIYDHTGEIIFENMIEGELKNHLHLASEVGMNILQRLTQEKIDDLNNLKDDFNYKAEI